MANFRFVTVQDNFEKSLSKSVVQCYIRGLYLGALSFLMVNHFACQNPQEINDQNNKGKHYLLLRDHCITRID